MAVKRRQKKKMNLRSFQTLWRLFIYPHGYPLNLLNAGDFTGAKFL